MTETKLRTPSAQEKRRPTQEERRNRSEAKLLRAALSIAAEEGVSAVTFENIAARAGYSRGLASQKFGSKQGLIRAVIDHLHEARDELLETQALARQTGLESLMTYVDMHFEALQESKENQAYFVLLAGAVGDQSELRELFAASHERAKLQLMAIVQRGQLDGSIRAEIDSEAAALMVGSLLVGIAVQALADPSMDLTRVGKETRAVLTASFAV